jgi:FkbM family methyltransferase
MREPSPAEKAVSLWSWWDLLIYSLFALTAFGQCLLWNQAYFDNDLLAQFGPWRTFLKDQLAQGHFPLWNPYLLGGEPFLANLQNMMFYPPNYLTLPFSVPRGLTIFYILHFFVAAFGMHLWLRSLGLSKTSARVGALLFAFSNFFWLELIHPPVLAAFAWLPWLFFSLERLAQKHHPLAGLGAGFTFALLFLGGSFQVTLGALYAGAAYLLFRLFQTRLSLKSLLLPSLLLLWGALPLLAQLIPTLEYSALCDRRAEPQAQGTFVSKLSLNPSTLHQLLFPRFTLPGDQPMAAAAQSTDPKENQWASLGYLGLWAPFLVLGAFRARDKKLSAFLLGLTLVGLALSLGSHLPLLELFRKIFPGFDQIRVPFRYLFLYVLGLSALAAYGYEAWASQSRNWLKTALPYGLLLSVAAFWHPGRNWREIVGLILGLGGLWIGSRMASWKNSGAFLFQAAILLPLFLNGLSGFLPGPSSNYDYQHNAKSLIRAAQELRPYRVIFGNALYYPIEVGGKKYALNFPQDAAGILGLKNFGGYNPLSLQAKKDLAHLPLKTAVKLGAIKGLLSQDPDLRIPGFKAKSFPPYILHEWQGPLTYTFTPNRIQVLAEPAKRIEFLSQPGFDPSREVVYSKSPPFWDNPKDLIDPGLEIKIVKDEADQQVFLSHLSRGTPVVFCETMFPGWKAWVDGKPRPIFTANHFMRSVYLPEGIHRLEFRFEPDWLRPILLGLLAWTLLTFLGLMIAFRQSLLALLKRIARLAGGSGLGRVKPIRLIYDSVFGLLKPKSVMVQGHRMWLDDKDTLELATNEIYEPLETALFKRELKPGQVVLDIGANIGYYTLLAARLVGPKGKVYAFEPDPVNFQLLRKNVEANGYGNVILVNKAVSNKTKATRLYLNETNKGDHRLYDSGDGRRSIAVEVVALDRFFKQLDKKVHFIKMDIQGAEAAALEGMKGLIRANRALKLVMEFEPSNLRRFGSDPQKVLQTLKKAGFRLLDISEKEKSVKPTDSNRLLKRYTVENAEYTNLFCVKG